MSIIGFIWFRFQTGFYMLFAIKGNQSNFYKFKCLNKSWILVYKQNKSNTIKSLAKYINTWIFLIQTNKENCIIDYQFLILIKSIFLLNSWFLLLKPPTVHDKIIYLISFIFSRPCFLICLKYFKYLLKILMKKIKFIWQSNFWSLRCFSAKSFTQYENNTRNLMKINIVFYVRANNKKNN